MRCEICDYTPDMGSDLRDIAPTPRISVRDGLCDDCRTSIDENVSAITPQDDEDFTSTLDELEADLNSQEEEADEEYGDDFSGC